MKLPQPGRSTPWILALVASLLGLARISAEAPPPIMSYQGRISIEQTNFNGPGFFKFALVNGTNGPTVWNNDGTIGDEPLAPVPIDVSHGLYRVLLGDTTLSGMTTPIGADVFDIPDVRLRVWFSSNAGGPFDQLAPDYRIASVGYALMAAEVPDGSITTNKLPSNVVYHDPLGGIQAKRIEADYFIGSGMALTNLNASNILSGILADTQLSTNVMLRDSAGGIQVRYVQADRYDGNGGELTNLNAFNILTGTLADERLSTNVVLRDDDGNVSAGIITAAGFEGDGSRLHELNADKIKTGTLGDARLSSRVARVDIANAFTHPDNQFFGQGSGLTNLNASAVRSGTLSAARLPTIVARLNRSQTFSGTNTFTNSANRFAGNGAGLMQLNAQALINGPLPDSLLSSNVLRRDSDDAIAAPRFTLPATLDADTGVLILGDRVFLHALGADNTYVGSGTGSFSGTGAQNTAVGTSALQSLTTGNQNSALGFAALKANETGNGNTALGVDALTRNTTGEGNVAAGESSLVSNTSGSRNVGIGQDTLRENTTGNGNIAIGYAAGKLLTTGDDNIMIGAAGLPDEARTIRIGTHGIQSQTIIAGIYSNTIPGGLAVRIDAGGKLGVLSSSRRYKEAIRDMANESDVILAMRPVEFRYKSDIDPQGQTQFGLIAEEVNEIAPHLVARDAQGEIQSVRYEAVNAMMLNEIKKQHLRLVQQEETIGDMKKQISDLNSKLTEATALLQKVAGQLSSAPAPAAETVSARLSRSL